MTTMRGLAVAALTLCAITLCGCDDDQGTSFQVYLQGFVIQRAELVAPDEWPEEQPAEERRLPQRFTPFFVASCATNYELADVNLYSKIYQMPMQKRDAQRFYTADVESLADLAGFNAEYTCVARAATGESTSFNLTFDFEAADTIAPVVATDLDFTDRHVVVKLKPIAGYGLNSHILGLLALPYNEGERPSMVDALICKGYDVRATDEGISYQVDLSNVRLTSDHAQLLPYCSNQRLVLREEAGSGLVLDKAQLE